MSRTSTCQKIRAVYEILFQTYGPQGWWPLSSPGDPRPRYHPGRWNPLSDGEIYEVFLGAILTQNTTWRNAEGALTRLLALDPLTPSVVAALPPGDLEERIRSSGYYRQKTQRLQEMSRSLLDLGGISVLAQMSPSSCRQWLLSLKGVGPETADSVLLYGFHLASFVIDAYTRRLALRTGWSHQTASYIDLQDLFSEALPARSRLYGEFHALIVVHAKDSCSKNRPRCDSCPIQALCVNGSKTAPPEAVPST